MPSVPGDEAGEQRRAPGQPARSQRRTSRGHDDDSQWICTGGSWSRLAHEVAALSCRIRASVSTTLFVGSEEVVDDRGVAADLPQAASLGEVDELVGFDVGETERGLGCFDLVGFLGVDDAGGAVREEALGEGDGFAAGGSDGAEVGDAVHDGDVRDAECAG